MTVDPAGALPIVPDTALPADVRNGTAADKQTYQAALGFERQLLTQLTQAMVDSSQNDDSSSDDGSTDESSSDAVTQAYSQMLPDQLANALVSGGGTGLADSLYQSLKQQSEAKS